jgi:prepilin-type N-terminal cleavage/methylation domain-containing protein
MGFTLIEVLVVVAIIALLIAILIPSLARARELARRSVCLSNMKQMGVGAASYSAESRGLFPWAGGKRYALMGGQAEQMPGGQGSRWVGVNIGTLYPRYVGRQALLFYCPSCLQLRPDDDEHGIPKLEYLTRNPVQTTPGQRPNDFPFAPQCTYVYARPAETGRHPRDAGNKMYQGEVIQSSPGGTFNPAQPGTWGDGWSYVSDAAESNWLVPIPKEGRLRAPVPVLMSDAYFGGFLGFHIDGYNCLFADLHARREVDPQRKIALAGLTSGRNYIESGGMNGTIGLHFQIWDYFSRNP